MSFTSKQLKVICLLAGVVGAWPATGVAASRLIINGRTVSTDVVSINGHAYGNLADLAKALGMVLVKRSDGSYELTKPGGTEQVQGLAGKIGDVLFDGLWRFQVLGVSAPETYTMQTAAEPDEGDYAGGAVQWDTRTRTFTPAAGYRLVLLQCRVINAVAQKRTLWIGDKETNTALADSAGQSHPPVAHDFEGAPVQSKPLLQGARLDFNLLFSVPQGTTDQDLVFTLVANGDLDHRHDVRVSLGNPAASGNPADGNNLRGKEF